MVYELLDRRDFVIDPLPNLVFTRDSSVWIGDRVAVSSLGPRGREARLLAVLYARHPRFAGTKMLYGPHLEPIAGGDIVLLAPGVIAVGVSEQTSPAGVERLARQAFLAGLAHTVLAVPIQRTGAAHLDTICTVIDGGAVVMHPALAYTLTVHMITPRGDGLRVSRPQPFMAAAAQAMGIERLTVIDTGLDPVTAPRGRRAAASGTTAATRCPSAAGWPSATSGTWRPTPGSPRRESRSSRCPRASWAAGAAARAACRAR